MDHDHDDGYVFRTPDFGKSSEWLRHQALDDGKDSPFFSIRLSREGDLPSKSYQDSHPQASKTENGRHSVFFGLPPLLKDSVRDEAGLAGAPDLDPIKAEARGNPVARQDVWDDLWLDDERYSREQVEFRTWDGFENHEAPSRTLSFLTEAGPVAFDGFISSTQSLSQACVRQGAGVAKDADYCAALLALAMGRSSLIFSWAASQQSFVKSVDLNLSGVSHEILEGVDRLCIECANSSRYLQSFVQATHPLVPRPSRVALARIVDQVLRAIQSELGNRGAGLKSILQLQSLVRPMFSVLSHFREVTRKGCEARSDEQVLSWLYREAQEAEFQDKVVQQATREILRLVSRPWLEFVEEWIGTRVEGGIAMHKSGPGKHFVKVGSRAEVDDFGHAFEEADYFLDEEKMPTFIPHHIGLIIFQTGRNLRFIREFHPEHYLSRQAFHKVAYPALDWKYDWGAIMRADEQAEEYEAAVMAVIRNPPCHPPRHPPRYPPPHPPPHQPSSRQEVSLDEIAQARLPMLGCGDEQIAAAFEASMSRMNEPLAPHHVDGDLTSLIDGQLFRGNSTAVHVESFSPHWTLIPLLSFNPVISAQARIVNRECVRLLFSSHKLREHINLQKRFHLLGDGAFCARLSHSLFDPALDKAERETGIALSGGKMGLRLGGRGSWPPASSELRLVLMGVLSESYDSRPNRARSSASGGWRCDLPGDLSFAVRELSSEQMEACTNPDSLQALDFLRLAYTPPPPLRHILTSAALHQYDRIFMLLLRILRMLFVVRQLFRHASARSSNASCRLTIEAHHFVSQMAAYFFDTGIALPWQAFEAWLDCVEAEHGGDASPDQLRDRHEQTLDAILHRLLLRKRQAPVLRLLEDIFTVVLQFAKHVRSSRQRGGDTCPETLYQTFRKKVDVFITVCKALSEKTAVKPGDDGSTADGDDTAIQRLMLMLDMTGYYARRS